MADEITNRLGQPPDTPSQHRRRERALRDKFAKEPGATPSSAARKAREALK